MYASEHVIHIQQSRFFTLFADKLLICSKIFPHFQPVCFSLFMYLMWWNFFFELWAENLSWLAFFTSVYPSVCTC